MLSNASGVAVISCLYFTQLINSPYFLDPLNKYEPNYINYILITNLVQ
jgi:hypothetical protein